MDTATKVMLAGFLTTVVAPATAALVATVPALLLRKSPRRPVLAGVGATVAAAAGIFAVRGFPAGIPTDTIDWVGMALLAIGAALVLTDLGRWRGRWPAATAGFALAVAGAGYLVLRPLFAGDAPPYLAWGVGIALSTAAFAFATRKDIDPKGSAGVFAALAMATGGSAAAIALSGSALVGQMLGAVATATGVLAVVAWLRPSLTPGRSAIGVVLAAIGSLAAYAYGYAEVHPATVVLLLLAPAGAVAASLDLAKWKRAGVALGAAAVPVLAAVAVAAFVPATTSSDTDDGYGYPTDSAEGDSAADDEYYLPY